MKKIYYLLIVVLVSLVSCVDLDGDLGPGVCANDVYFYNELDKDITLRIFDGRKVKKYKLKQNDSVYFTTVVYSNPPGMFIFPGGPAYDRTISSIDSVKVTYNKNVYTYYHLSFYIFSKEKYPLILCFIKKEDDKDIYRLYRLSLSYIIVFSKY